MEMKKNEIKTAFMDFDSLLNETEKLQILNSLSIEVLNRLANTIENTKAIMARNEERKRTDAAWDCPEHYSPRERAQFYGEFS